MDVPDVFTQVPVTEAILDPTRDRSPALRTESGVWRIQAFHVTVALADVDTSVQRRSYLLKVAMSPRAPANACL